MLAPLLGIARLVPVWAWAVVAVLAWGGWQKHRAETATRAAAQQEQAAALQAAAAAGERQARQLEQTYADNVRSATDAYSANLRRARAAAADTRSKLDRLRDAIAAAPGACPAGTGASAPGRADGAAELRGVLGSCARSLSQLAEAADADAARLTALQAYVRAIGATASAPGP